MKKALIVDDSRLARHVLSQMLNEHGVAADTAESAEAALDYLNGHRPDVIFLDHQMPGMDGFQALEAIKRNPVTATIPVMMYTSKEGELYVGQARALGALGVLPKSVEPVEVTKVLRSLHLIPGEPRTATADGPMVPAAVPLDARQLRALLAELFYEQGATLREELRREIHSLAPSPPSPPTVPEPAPVPKQPALNLSRVAFVVLLAASAALAYFYFSTVRLLTDAQQRARNLATTATQLSEESSRALGAERRAASAGVLEVLTWGVNQGGAVAFGDVPLDDQRAAVLTTLAAELDRLGFSGIVAVDVHVGRFCMGFVDGKLTLAGDEQPAASCDRIGWTEVEVAELSRQESLTFAYARADLERRYPQLRVETISLGAAWPLTPYPTAFEATAGEWNAIAARNQRVEVRLVENGD
jgi:CheY-like chemotaxis protein